MAILVRVHRSLIRWGFSKPWTQRLWLAGVVLAVLWGVWQDQGMSALATSANGPLGLPLANDKQAAQAAWNTVYGPLGVVSDAPAAAAGVKVEGGSKHKARTTVETSLPSGEALFLQTQQLLSAGQLTQALGVAQSMVERYPHFQLGQLVYADLLASMVGGVSEREHWLQQPELQQRLAQLHAEALQRTRHGDRTALEGKYPAQVRYLSSSVRQVVVVDAQKSRLYVLAKGGDGPGVGGFKVVLDAYVSIGNKGMGKWREGDGKTPVGVYFIQKHLTDPMLPDLYGSGALTLDYPSPLDKALQRTGSGIWLHGSPSQQYARPPTATDGCVVLANDDMTRLVQLGLKADTPVIMAEQLTWLDADPRPLAPSAWPQPEHTRKSPGDWQLVSAFEWKDKQQSLAVLSHELRSTEHATKRRHSYWVMERQRWKEVGQAF